MAFFIAAFRNNVGTDYIEYEFLYSSFSITELFEHDIEIGFELLMYCLKLLQLDSQSIFVFSSAIILFCTFYSIYQCKVPYGLGIYFFIAMGFYFQSLNIIRQYIALSIFLMSIKYIDYRDFKSYIRNVFIGFLFHKSILVTIPFYFLLKRSYSRRFYLCGLILVLIFLLLKSKVFNCIANIGIDYVSYSYIAYFVYYKYSEENIFLSVFAHIDKILFFLYLVYNGLEKLRDKTIFLNIFYFAMIAELAFRSMGDIQRLGLYLVVSYCMAIPILLKNINSRCKMKFMSLFIIVYLLKYFYILQKNLYNIVPYSGLQIF